MTIVGRTFEGSAENRGNPNQVNSLFVPPRVCTCVDASDNHMPEPLLLIPGLNCTGDLFVPLTEALSPRMPVIVADVGSDATIAAMAGRAKGRATRKIRRAKPAPSKRAASINCGARSTRSARTNKYT